MGFNSGFKGLITIFTVKCGLNYNMYPLQSGTASVVPDVTKKVYGLRLQVCKANDDGCRQA